MTKPNSHNSIFLSGTSWPIFHGLATLFILLMMLIQTTSLSEYIDTHFTSPLYFRTRQALHKTPPLDSRIKIIVLDDDSFSYLGKPRPSKKQLTSMLENIATQKPRAILIDSLLSDFPEAEDESSKENLRAAPIFSGNFLTPANLSYRTPVDTHLAPYRFDTYLSHGLEPKDLTYELEDRSGMHPYGFSSAYRDMIRATGHITYNPDGTVAPFYRLDAETIIPHLSLFAGASVELRRDALWINEFPVPLSHKGNVLINHRPSQNLYERAISLQGVLERAEAKKMEIHVQEGDVVLILLAFATGNTDFLEDGPFGILPGGLVIANMVSDILDGTWIKSIELDLIFIVFFGIAGVVLGINARSIRYWLTLLGVWLLVVLLAILLFSYLHLWVPVFISLLAFTGTSLIHFAHVRIQVELRLMLIERNYFAERARRLEESAKKSELQIDMGLGRAVQKLLLPTKMDDSFQPYHYQLRHKPIPNLAGDWFYVWGNSLLERYLLIGDVMGTGPSAAIPMASIIAILGECEARKMPFLDTLNHLSKRLSLLYDNQVACSLSAVRLKRDSKIQLFNAGGPGWFLAGPGQAEHFPMRSRPLGLSPDTEIAQQSIDLRDKQYLFAFTDGYINDIKDLRLLTRQLRQTPNLPENPLDLENMIQLSLQPSLGADDQSLLCVQLDRRSESR